MAESSSPGAAPAAAPGRRRRRVQPLDAARRAARRLVPERRRDPSIDGRLGSAADPRRAPPVRRLVSLPVARRLALPPLPEPAAHPDRRRVHGPRRRDRSAGRSTSCCARGRSPSTAAVGCSTWSHGPRAWRPSSRRSIVSAPALGFEWSSYVWRGSGTWAQLWGMWALPFAWGLSWRAVSKGRTIALAALVLGLTICLHLLIGLPRVVEPGRVGAAGAERPLAPGRTRRARGARCAGDRRRGCWSRSSPTRSG